MYYIIIQKLIKEQMYWTKQHYKIKYFVNYECGSDLLIECPYV
jgi:hypothetical protein